MTFSAVAFPIQNCIMNPFAERCGSIGAVLAAEGKEASMMPQIVDLLQVCCRPASRLLLRDSVSLFALLFTH